MTERLKQLYKTIILKHNNEPCQFEKREEAQYKLEAYNPLCGDHFHLYLNLEENLIKQISFFGYGCAISKAATSVLVKQMEGLDLDSAQALCLEFEKVIQSDQIHNKGNEAFEAFGAVKEFPARLPCVKLSWMEMTNFLKDQLSNKKSASDQ